MLDNFFAFSKGDMLVMLTNSSNTVSVQMPYLPWAVGTEVCNIFWPTVDCFTITSTGMAGVLMNGEAKIFVPKSNSFFTSYYTETELLQ